MYPHYNILPLDSGSSNREIMRLEEIQASVTALRSIEGLPWPRGHKHKLEDDILDWLQAMFGFQKDNVSNQREHIILLLANAYIRQFPKPDDQQPKLNEQALRALTVKVLGNYKNWCHHHKRNPWLLTETTQQEMQQRELIYICLYLLIWGEAANLRFMPECLCYIFHNMAFEICGMLTDEDIKPIYGGEEEAFLRKVVTPIYELIAEEARGSRERKSKHSRWRTMTDLNEYFWSVDCFRLGWPIRADADFFRHPTKQLRSEKK